MLTRKKKSWEKRRKWGKGRMDKENIGVGSEQGESIREGNNRQMKGYKLEIVRD